MFYAVTIGRRAGIYLHWDECKAVVDKYSGAVFKKHPKLHEATEYMNRTGYCHSDILVHADMVSLPLRDYCYRQMIQVPFEVAALPCNLFDLGRGLRVEACAFNDEDRIDIRQWDEETNKRTLRGISLTLQQWDELMKISEDLYADLQGVKADKNIQASYELPGSVFATIQSPYRVYHIRRWYCDANNELKPGKQGITLREKEWQHLLDLKHQLAAAHQKTMNIENPSVM